MRRLKRIPAIVAALLSLMLTPNAMAQRSAYGVDWMCGYQDGAVFLEQLRRANQEDLSCLAGAGFWEEAFPRIGGRMDEERQRLRLFLDLLLNGSEEAFAFFEEDAAAGQDEAILWMLIARGDRGLAISDRRTRSVAVNLFVALPPWARTRFSAPLAEALMAEGDSRAALTLGTALRTIALNNDSLAQAAMIQALVTERYGATDEAVALYEEAGELGNDRLAAEAELRKIALMWRTGYIQSEEAVAVLQELVTIWRGERLGAGITLALARAFYFDQQLPQSIRLLAGVIGSEAPEDIRLEAETRLRETSEDLFVRRIDPATIGDLMDVYEIVRPMVAPADEFWLGDMMLARDLMRAGLITRAQALMVNAAPGAVREAGGNPALFDSAEMMISFDNLPAARRFLSGVQSETLDDEQRLRFARLQAQSAPVEQLTNLLGPGIRRDVLGIIINRAWKEGAYGLYTEARRYADADDTWRDPTAAYLARGDRLDREQSLQEDDVRLRALSSAPKLLVYHAEDLRPLLEPSVEVAELAANLTQIGQELSEGASDLAEEAADASTRDE